ncbi:MAG: hypothetical protein LBE82_12520 [Chitinophagaceae bacterium]|nr:hypothetical protein [Chitinophagaceae bacterium]
MESSFLQIIIFLIISIALIVLLTVRYKVHAFFALLAACVVMGLGVGLSAETIITNTLLLLYLIPYSLCTYAAMRRED